MEVQLKDFLCDDTLLLAAEVEYLTESVWKVTVLTPHSQMISLSCRLTSVTVIPLLTLTDLEKIINEDSERILLRVDYVQRGTINSTEMITVLNGDVLFLPKQNASSHRWMSLQETLVLHRLGYLSRPTPFRWTEMEKLALSAIKPTGFENFDETASCTVVDVARGDTFVVEWSEAAQRQREALQREPYPPVLVLRMTPCETFREEQTALTQSAFAALMFSRQFLGQELTVRVHSVCPSERDLACNSYAYSLDRRGAVEGTAKDEQGRDISGLLLENGLAKLREIPFPFDPHFLHVYACVVQLTEKAVEQPLTKDEEWEEKLRRRIKMSSQQLKELVQFLGSSWALSHQASMSAKESEEPQSWTRIMLHNFIWAGNYKAVKDEKSICLFRPLRTVMPMSRVAQLAILFKGYAKQMLLHTNVCTSPKEKHHYLQVDMEVWASEEQWDTYLQLGMVQRQSYFAFSPEPEEDVFHNVIHLSVQYFGIEKVRLGVRAKVYSLEGFNIDAVESEKDKKDVVEVDHHAYDFPTPFQAVPGVDQILVCDVYASFTGLEDDGVGDEGEIVPPKEEHRRVFYFLSANKPYSIEEDTTDLSLPTASSQHKPEDKDVDENGRKATVLFVSTVPFFFRCSSSAQLRKEAVPKLLSQLRKAVCLPVDLAWVDGTLGFVGDIYFCPENQDTNFCTFQTKEFDDLKVAKKSFLNVMADLFEAHTGDALMREVLQESAHRREQLILESKVKLLDAPSRLRISACADLYISDSSDPTFRVPTLSEDILPSSLSLLTFSWMNRLLVPENPIHACVGVAVESKANKKGRYDIHPDYSLWTDVRFPMLPNVLKGHLGQLPYALRNTERAFCQQLLSSPDQPSSHERKGETPPLYGAMYSIVSFLTLLFHLRLLSMRSQSMYDRFVVDSIARLRELLPSRLHNPDDLKCSYTAKVVLYRLHRASGSHWSLFLGSRDTYRSDFMELPSPTTVSSDLVGLQPRVFRRVLQFLFFETIAQKPPVRKCNNCSGEPGSVELLTSVGDRQISGVTDFGYTRRDQSRPVLYHPLPWLHVLGDPLLERREEDVTGQTTLHHFSISYRVPFLSRKFYKSESYGRMTKKVLRDCQRRLWQRLQPVRDWLSVLLQRSKPFRPGDPGIAATGKMHFFGTATEPVSVWYLTKKQLRVDECFPTELSTTEVLSEAEQDTKDLTDLAEPMRRILEEIDQHFSDVQNSRFALLIQSVYPLERGPYMSIKIRRVDEELNAGAETDMTEEWKAFETKTEPTVVNPHRPFAESIYTDENPDKEMHVTYNLLKHCFEWKWFA